MRQMVQAEYLTQCSMETGWWGLIANNNGHHWEPKFDNENEHHDLHIYTLQTFLAQLHE